MIVFTKTKDGHYVARVDQIELAVCSIYYDLTVYENETVYPCDYGDCPSGRTEETCPTDVTCIHAYEAETMTSSDMHGGFSSFEEVEKYLRRMFATGINGDKDDPGSSPWPQPAAERLAHEEWHYVAQPAEDITG